MVKPGFLNLSPQEQARVMEAALDEFSQKEYEAASLNQIIHNAGISKGSMYHYFYNKEDLYLYILDRIMAEKSRFMTDALVKLGRPPQELDFFETLRLQLEMSIAFGRANPRYHMINTHLQNMNEGPLKERIWGRFHVEFDRYMSQMVNTALGSGQIRSSLSKEFTLRILKFMLLRFTDFYPDYLELLEKGDNTMMKEMELLIDFLKHGLQGPIKEEE